MKKQRKNSFRLFSRPIMYFLFGVSVLGIVLSVYFLERYHAVIEFSTVHRSLFMSFGWYLVYCVVIIFCSRWLFGVFAIPAVIFIRAFIYSTAVHVFALNCALTRDSIFLLYSSGVFEMSGFLYLASISFGRSLNRLNRASTVCRNIRELKVGFLLAIICAIIGFAVETFLFVS